MSSLATRDREQDGQDSERSLKRARIEDGLLGPTTDSAVAKAMDADVPMEVEDNLDRSSASTKNPLPPSHRLLGISKLPETSDGSAFRISEVDVGISEYIGKDVPKIEGIIKQRFVFQISFLAQIFNTSKDLLTS
jgi:tRNA pseudouridine13 synthase